jgi:hypothetical protein
MIKNATQLKDRIKNINKHGSVQAQVYLRIFIIMWQNTPTSIGGG